MRLQSCTPKFDHVPLGPPPNLHRSFARCLWQSRPFCGQTYLRMPARRRLRRHSPATPRSACLAVRRPAELGNHLGIAQRRSTRRRIASFHRANHRLPAAGHANELHGPIGVPGIFRYRHELAVDEEALPDARNSDGNSIDPQRHICGTSHIVRRF